jgi:hypothetical protein
MVANIGIDVSMQWLDCSSAEAGRGIAMQPG